MQQAAEGKGLSVAKVRDLVKDLPSAIVPKTNDEHDIASGGHGHWGARVEQVKQWGPDLVLANERVKKWWNRVIAPPMPKQERELEEALGLLLPRMTNRVSYAETLREAAARLTALAERIETFEPAPVEQQVQEEAEAVTA